MPIKDRGICIRVVDYSETSQVVTVFTRDNGKISAIAKGSKRAKSAFDGPLEMLSMGSLMFSPSAGGQGLATLTEFDQLPFGTALAGSYLGMNCGLFAAELVDEFTDELDPHPELFDYFEKFLQRLCQVDQNRQRLGLAIWFELKLLDQAGLGPIFERCGNCGKEFDQNWPGAYFSSDKSCLLCRDCQMSFPDRLAVSTEAVFCLAQTTNIRRAGPDTLKNAQKLLLYHLRQCLGKKLKMGKYTLQG